MLMSDLCTGASSVSRNVPLPSVCLARTEIMLSPMWRNCSVPVTQKCLSIPITLGKNLAGPPGLLMIYSGGRKFGTSKPSTFLLVLLVCREQHCICYYLTGRLSQQKLTLKISLRNLYCIQQLQENGIFTENIF